MTVSDVAYLIVAVAFVLSLRWVVAEFIAELKANRKANREMHEQNLRRADGMTEGLSQLNMLIAKMRMGKPEAAEAAPTEDFGPESTETFS